MALGRSQDAYDRFAAAVEVPLTALAVVWLAVLVVPLIAHVGAGLADTFDLVDYFVWPLSVVVVRTKPHLIPIAAGIRGPQPLDLVVSPRSHYAGYRRAFVAFALSQPCGFHRDLRARFRGWPI